MANNVVTIDIRVRHLDEYPDDPVPANRGRRKGSFSAPDPLVSVHTGTLVRWSVVEPAGATFMVRFSKFSPFGGLEITDDTPRAANNNGAYHYKVFVMYNGEVFTIGDCPEIDVGTP